MPVLESTERAMPRSALRHRLSESDADQQGKVVNKVTSKQVLR